MHWKLMILPLLTAILTAVLSGVAMDNWSTFWNALEAIGTVAAVFAAIYLAWQERSKDRRRAESQRQAIRVLLRHEIEKNLCELKDWRPETAAMKTFNLYAFAQFGFTVHEQVVEKLEQQLDLYTDALNAVEIREVSDFFWTLRRLKLLQQKLYGSTWLNPSVVIPTSALDVLEDLIDLDEYRQLMEGPYAPRTKPTIAYIIEKTYTKGQELVYVLGSAAV